MNASGTQSPPIPGSDRVDPALRRLTYTLIVGALAVIFDTTIMSVAIDSLAGQLHTSLATIQWVTTAYLLALSATMPTVGWAQSVLGGKRLWILALGLFFAGSMLCAAAWNAPSVIAFRVVQGIGGGIMMVLMATLAMQAAGGRNIGKVMSLITVPTALGPIIGPVIGGVILHLGDWRWIFLFNIPFCLVGGYLAWRNLPKDRPRPGTGHRLDLVGVLLLTRHRRRHLRPDAARRARLVHRPQGRSAPARWNRPAHRLPRLGPSARSRRPARHPPAPPSGPRLVHGTAATGRSRPLRGHAGHAAVLAAGPG